GGAGRNRSDRSRDRGVSRHRELQVAPAHVTRYRAAMKEGFGTFDHTGDLGLEVWAESPERLYALAAEAVMAQIARPIETGATEVETGRLELEVQDPGDL